MAVAYINERLRQKNASGDYDIMHLESESGLILRSGSSAGTFKEGTVEDALTSLESSSSTLSSRTVKLTGDVTGTGTVDASGNSINVTTTVGDDNHNHTGTTIAISGTTAGNFLTTDSNGHPVAGSSKAADFATSGHTHALTSSSITGTLNVGKGGTGKTSLTSGSYLVGAGTSAVTLKTPAQVLSDIGAAGSGHTHDITGSTITGTLPISKGGTGATTAAAARTALGAAASDHNHDSAYLAVSLKGANSGLAELDSTGKVPSSQLPSFVDDVLEYDSKSSFPTTGETGKIYVATDNNKTYRWSGSAYVEISASLALGETSSTAYRGDRGKTAYDHSQATHARTDATAVAASSTNGNITINGTETTVYTHPTATAKSAGLYKVTVNGTGHVTAATAVAASDIKGLSSIDMTGASSSAAGAHGMVPAPAKGDQNKVLSGAGTWVDQFSYTHPTQTEKAAGAYKIGNNSLGHVVVGDALTYSDVGAAPEDHDHLWADITDKPTEFTPTSHNHAASNITSGTLAVARGGTGVTSNPSMLINLASTSAASVFASSPRPGVTGTLAIANGGTGATSAAAARTALGVINVQSGSTQPTNQAAGDLWYETLT